MKLEVPNIRIMRGEAKDLSSNASKLLLILLACQDQHTQDINWSPEAMKEITKLPRSTFYEARKELIQKNWIEAQGKRLKVRPDRQNVQEPEEKVRPHGQNVQEPEEKVRPDEQKVRPDGLDQIDLDLRSDLMSFKEIDMIANFYHFNESEIDQLIETCKGKSKAGILMIFESMRRKEIKNPLQYIKKSIYNLNGTVTIQKKSPTFFEAFPEMQIKSRWAIPE